MDKANTAKASMDRASMGRGRADKGGQGQYGGAAFQPRGGNGAANQTSKVAGGGEAVQGSPARRPVDLSSSEPQGVADVVVHTAKFAHVGRISESVQFSGQIESVLRNPNVRGQTSRLLQSPFQSSFGRNEIDSVNVYYCAVRSVCVGVKS